MDYVRDGYRRNDRNDSRRHDDRQPEYRRNNRHNYDREYSPHQENSLQQSYKGGRYQEDRKSNNFRQKDDNHQGNTRFNDNKNPKGNQQFRHESRERDMSDSQDTCREQGETSASSIPNCYECREDDHYVNQCPTKEKGKAPTVNMVMLEIQQMTTRSKGKQSEWEVQEEIRKTGKESLEEANQNNVNRMKQYNVVHQKEHAHQLFDSILVNEPKETWKVFAYCQISLSLAGLLKLVPRFTEKVSTLVSQKDVEQVWDN